MEFDSGVGPTCFGFQSLKLVKQLSCMCMCVSSCLITFHIHRGHNPRVSYLVFHHLLRFSLQCWGVKITNSGQAIVVRWAYWKQRSEILQGVPKKWTFCICLISQEPRNGFLNPFFLLKTEIHM